MWMLMGLVGLLVASSMADAFAPSEATDGIDESEAGGADDAASVDEVNAQTGDLLADADDAPIYDDQGDDDLGDDGDAIPDTSEPDADTAPDDTLQIDGLPFYRPPDSDDDGLSDDWFDNEFLSTDAPVQSPPDYYISLDDDGDQTAGGQGNDTIVGGTGDDWLDGQDGNDDLMGRAGNDTLIGGRGEDTLTGGAGDDSLVSGSGDGLLIGASGNDVLMGGEDNDSLFGGADNDTLQGGYGDDVLVAGTGEDVLFGGDGNDTLFGYTPDSSGRDIDGADVMNAGDGDDVLVLGSGDTASGGDGADTFVLGSWIDPDAPALITDFDPQSDVLSIAYDASGDLPEITTVYDAEAGGLQVLLNGEIVAFLTGVETLDVGSVIITAVEGNTSD